MALNLRNKILEFLKSNPEQKYTGRQIAKWIFEQFPEECRAKKDNSRFISSDAELIQQLAAEISSQRPGFRTSTRKSRQPVVVRAVITILKNQTATKLMMSKLAVRRCPRMCQPKS